MTWNRKNCGIELLSLTFITVLRDNSKFVLCSFFPGDKEMWMQHSRHSAQKDTAPNILSRNFSPGQTKTGIQKCRKLALYSEQLPSKTGSAGFANNISFNGLWLESGFFIHQEIVSDLSQLNIIVDGKFHLWFHLWATNVLSLKLLDNWAIDVSWEINPLASVVLILSVWTKFPIRGSLDWTRKSYAPLQFCRSFSRVQFCISRSEVKRENKMSLAEVARSCSRLIRLREPQHIELVAKPSCS